MVTFDVKDKVGEQPWIPSDDCGCSREMWLTLSRVLWLARNIREYPPAEACPFKQTTDAGGWGRTSVEKKVCACARVKMENITKARVRYSEINFPVYTLILTVEPENFPVAFFPAGKFSH